MNTNFTTSLDNFEANGVSPVVQAITNASDVVSTLASNTNLITSCMIQNVSDPSTAAQDLSVQLQAIDSELNSINNTYVVYLNGNLTLMVSMLATFQANTNTALTLVTNLGNMITSLPGEFEALADSLKQQILSSTIPNAISAAHAFANQVTQTLITFTQCKVLADDWLAFVYSLCQLSK
jgi:hypothetical protein